MTTDDLDALIAKIEKVVGRKSLDRAHLQQAVTHRSYVNEATETGIPDNERYEFLGDAVLQLAVSDFLMRRYPDEPEGTLSKFRSSIVNERSLAQAARTMELGKFIRLGKGEELTQGRKKDSILADAFEAVVASIYLSGGISDAALFVEHFLKSALSNVIDASEKQDFKTTLQELTQRYLKKTPMYKLALEEGPDHDKVFESEVWIGPKLYGKGKAKSKKDSEQLCAEEAITLLREDIANGQVGEEE
jgi:ribonuclease III